MKSNEKILTLWCPKSFKMVPNFLVLLCGFWAAAAGWGSRQSMDKRWYQRRWFSRIWADLTLGSKRCTSHPLLAMLTSNRVSSLPSLWKKRRMEINTQTHVRKQRVLGWQKDSCKANFLSYIKPSPILTRGYLNTFNNPSFTKSTIARSFQIRERREITC